MKANHQFSIAIHLMACLGYRRDLELTSAELARSVNTSPSFIRRTLSKLAKANLVRTTKGKTGACRLAQDANRITMLDIYRAVDAPAAFAIHRYPAQKVCTVSCRIKDTMESVLGTAQSSLEEGLRKVSLAELVADLD